MFFLADDVSSGVSLGSLLGTDTESQTSPQSVDKPGESVDKAEAGVDTPVDDASPSEVKVEYTEPTVADLDAGVDVKAPVVAGLPEHEDMASLFGGIEWERSEKPEMLSLDTIAVSEVTKQTRVHTLKGLGQSVIDFKGVLSPVDVVVVDDDPEDPLYQLVSGMRRFYGAAKAGHDKIPAFVWRFKDMEQAGRLAFLLGVVLHRQTKHDWLETWNVVKTLDLDYGLKPGQIEVLVPVLEPGDAMRLKDVALGEFDEPRELLWAGTKTLDQAYKLLQKSRKELDTLEVEEQDGVVSGTDLASDDASAAVSDKLTHEEVLDILDMDSQADFTDEDLFKEPPADADHVQDRKGDGDDDLSVDAKNKIKLRDKFLCRACRYTRESKYTEVDPQYLEDAPALLSTLTVHHIVPVHAGGTDDDRNLVTLCLQCHHMLHVMEKVGGLVVDKETFEKMSPWARAQVTGAYFFAEKAIEAGKRKGYSRAERHKKAQESMHQKMPGLDIKNDAALLAQLSKN